MTELLAGTKCKTKANTPLTPAGTPVVIDKDSKGEVVIGKTEKIFCKMPNGGSLFFDKSNLEAVAAATLPA